MYYYISTENPYQILKIDSLYDLIILLYEGKANLISDNQIKELKLPKEYNTNLKKKISKFEDKIPLYDILSNHIYLINKDNIYPNIFYYNYRFIDDDFLKDLIKKKNPTNSEKENIRILLNYDLKVLNKTYMKLFYKSFILNSFITNCKRPSFLSGMEHISPYYQINELYYLAYDWNLIKKSDLSEKEIKKLCLEISKYDIPGEILLNHQIYIYDSKAIGLVKNYSLFGSYYMNYYLRNNKFFLKKNNYQNVIRNLDLENQIKIMIKLIINSPPFSKAHTVYRFIEKDEFMRNYNIGDIYIDSSFMSTTRNPFYYKENYSFGYILLKIKIPANIKGIGLCIESYSNFPNEEEIILPPSSKYRIDNIFDSNDIEYYHNMFNMRVIKKYEMTWINNDFDNNNDIIFDMPESIIPEIKTINFNELIKDLNFNSIKISDRLSYFKEKYLNQNNQFSTIIGENQYIFSFEAYDSTDVYKPFFYYEIKDGIMLTTTNPKYGNINILLELGYEIHINYYFKFSLTDKSIFVDINKNEWIEWFSKLAYILGIRSVIIHSNYILNYNKNDDIYQKQQKTRYTFSQNIYLYMKEKKKFYQIPEITPKFDYYQLDYLFSYPIEDILNISDKDEIYRIYKDININNVGDFYIYIVENYPKFILLLEKKISQIFEPDKNPFENIMYELDAWTFLYNKNIISYIPPEKDFLMKKGSFKKLIGDNKILKFKNRLRTFLLSGKNLFDK